MDKKLAPLDPPLPFASGVTRIPPSTRTFDEAIEDAQAAPKERLKNKLRRRYRSPGTPATRRITQRIVGEREE